MKPDTYLGTPSPHQKAEGTSSNPDIAAFTRCVRQSLGRKGRLNALLANSFSWDEVQIKADSPCKVPSSPAAQVRAILKLFEPEELVTGCEHPSPDAATTWSCKGVSNWLKGDLALTLILPTVIKGNFAWNSGEDRPLPKFFIVTVSGVGNSVHCAVFRWLQEEVGLRLRAVVKGCRAYDAWFDMPDEETRLSLETWLPLVGASAPGTSPPVEPIILADGEDVELLYIDLSKRDRNA